jgi:hypothetical protein
VTVTILASGRALVILTAAAFSSNGSNQAFMSYAASPAGTSGGPLDARSLEITNNDETRASATVLVSGLPRGSVTFTAEYKVSPRGGGASATFANRDIVVIPLP